ncbi:MAG TPA: cupin domain-containing protein [Candidatus Lustribacter sp.]|jgi:mannose-6-phosphate isomerase-like protein (cupin superfamily)|nr:cupin domain-containing protein [Candidatus Lustribacter sp.]
MDDVKVIAARFTDRPKTDPDARVFTIADHIVVGAEKQRAGRMYVGDEFRAVVITISPGEAQTVHMHPETSHAWFVVSGSGLVTMEDGRQERIEAGQFAVHPRNSVHGLLNDRDENLTYIALSIGA